MRLVGVYLTSNCYPRNNSTSSPPFVVTIIPDNDSGQTVTLSTNEINVLETDLINPIYLYSNLTISDDDDSPCNQQLLRAAQVTVVDSAQNPSDDVLMVSDDWRKYQLISTK